IPPPFHARTCYFAPACNLHRGGGQGSTQWQPGASFENGWFVGAGQTNPCTLGEPSGRIATIGIDLSTGLPCLSGSPTLAGLNAISPLAPRTGSSQLISVRRLATVPRLAATPGSSRAAMANQHGVLVGHGITIREIGGETVGVDHRRRSLPLGLCLPGKR